MEHIKKGLKISVFVILFIMFALVILRIFVLDNSGPAKDILWTEDAKRIYNESPDDFKIYWFDAEEHLSADGYLAVVEVRYLKESRQLEFTLRCRESSLKKLRKQLGDKEDAESRFEPCLVKKSAEGTEQVFDFYEVSSEKQFYRYQRFVFDDVDLDELIEASIDIKYTGDIQCDYVSMKLYSQKSYLREYDYSSELPGINEYDIVKKSSAKSF